MALTVPESPPTKTIVYTDLLGVDFSQDASLVDRQHSPDMLNMISDEGGSPVKRKGWEVLIDLDAEIVDLHHFESGEYEYYLVVYKAEISDRWWYFVAQYFPETRTMGEGHIFGDAKPTYGFFFDNNYYIANPVYADGSFTICTPNDGTVTFSTAEPKIPTVLISRNPSTGGGVAYENINLLTPYRTEQFADPAGTAKNFLLGSSGQAYLGKLEYLDSDGTWKTDNTATITQTNNRYWCSITTAHPFYASTGADNIRVTYYASEAIAAQKRIPRCTNYAFYSHGGLDQIFVTGNPNYPNYIWYSNYGDPTYFPDLNYIIAGSAGTKCKGFLNVDDNLAVIKETSDQDSSVFFISETSITTKTVSTNTSNGSESETTAEYAYKIKRASTKMGAVSNRCFGTLQDEPLYLSENGVQGLVSMNSTTEKVVKNRSKHVDRKLLAEPNLENAISCVCNGYYYIFINDHVYILDSRHASSDKRGNTNYAYEAYYWENVPAKCVCVANENIYFGTEDGKLCRFKDTGEMTDYSDGSHYDAEQQKQVGGVAIHARYATKNDDDNAPQFFKTMMKKGSMCTVAPYFKSSVDVYIMADGTPATAQELYYDRDGEPIYDDNVPGIYIGTHYSNVDNIFPRIDFSRLLFDTRRSPRDYFFRKKKKKYVRLQITLENRELNEGFGVYSIVKTYTMTRYAK